ncbi:MAG: nucleotidyltransferase family protein [Ardenticatenales bacterium]
MSASAFNAPPSIPSALDPPDRLALARDVGRLAVGAALGLPDDALVRRVAERLGGRTGAAAEAFGRWAEQEGVAALIAPSLRRRVGPDRVSAVIPDLLDDTARRVALRALALSDDRARSQSALAAEGVPWRPIKGAWLADNAYRSPDVRPMADTDVFVPGAMLAAADRALTSLGYARGVQSWKHIVYRRPGEAVVDPRGEHVDNPRPMEVHPRWGDAFRGVWLDVGAMDGERLGGPPYACAEPWPDRAAMMIHVAAHATVDALGRRLRLLALVDAAVLAAQLTAAEWQAVRRSAGNARAARFVWPALALARRDLGAAIPDDVLATLAGHVRPALRRWLDDVDVDCVGRHGAGARRSFFEVPRIWPIDARERRTVWRWILWPPRAALVDREPRWASSALWPMAYARHTVFLGRGACRRLRQRRGA